MSRIPKGGWKQERDSLSKLRVYFQDGQKRSFYSWDWKSRYDPSRDRQLGISGLEERIIHKYQPQIKQAILYDMATNNEIKRYVQYPQQ